jgi:hypothetical protein
MNSGRPMRAISLRNNVFLIIESVKDEITQQRQKVDRHARIATYSEAVWQVLKESGRVPTK